MNRTASQRLDQLERRVAKMEREAFFNLLKSKKPRKKVKRNRTLSYHSYKAKEEEKNKLLFEQCVKETNSYKELEFLGENLHQFGDLPEDATDEYSLLSRKTAIQFMKLLLAPFDRSPKFRYKRTKGGWFEGTVTIKKTQYPLKFRNSGYLTLCIGKTLVYHAPHDWPLDSYARKKFEPAIRKALR